VFSWSYTALPPEAARLFRLLGVHPGPDIDLHAAVSLADLPEQDTGELLTKLIRAHLLNEHTPNRYRFHDLLRVYAIEQATKEEPDPQRRMALHRVLDYYLHTSFTANRHLSPHRDPITLEIEQSGVTPYQITNHKQALEWFITEHAVLLDAIDHAAAHRFNTHAWQLPWTLSTFLNLRGHWHDYAATQQTALTAAERLGDRTAQALAHRGLGNAHIQLRRYDEASTHLQQALTLCQKLGDRTGQAETHLSLSWVCEQQSKYTETLTHAQHVLDLYRTTGNHAGQARALNAVGWCHALLGHHPQAAIYCQQALNLNRELGNRRGEADTLDSLGYIYHHLDHHQEATTHYHQALTLYHELGDYYDEADTLTSLGNTYHATGNFAAARENWQQALTIFDDLGHPDADTVRTKLATLDTNPDNNR
jgi:tetratricopeptide (TPR) repeat protein